MRRRVPIGLVSALGALALTSGVAQAATVTAGGAFMSYTAGPGETNSLTFARSGDDYVLTDAAAVTITPTAPCVAGPTANVATCPVASVDQASISLSDLGDVGVVASSVGSDLTFVQVLGGPGGDTLTNDSLVGNPSLVGEAGGDSLNGGRNPDSLLGDDGDDIVAGNGGGDFILDGPGRDTYRGGDGNDFFAPDLVADEADTFIGNAGTFDQVTYQQRSVSVTVSNNGIADDGERCPGPTCEGDLVDGDIEAILGGTGGDTLTGGPGDDFLEGLDGNDLIDGSGGSDDLLGDDGNDTLTGGDGADSLFGEDDADVEDGGPGDDFLSSEFSDTGSDLLRGGSGEDTLSSFSETSPLRIDLNGVADDGISDPAIGAALDSVEPDVENVDGGLGDDVLIGNGEPNVLDGYFGDDTVIGAGGADTLFGQEGNDTLDGGPDSDTMDGATGADTLRSRDLSPDQLDCGSSLDSLLGDPLDLPEASCEQTSLGLVIGEAKLSKSGKKVKLAVTCPALEGIACAVSAALKAKGKTVASGTGTVASGATTSLSLKAKDPIKGKLKTDASATFADAQGVALTTTRKVTVG